MKASSSKCMYLHAQALCFKIIQSIFIFSENCSTLLRKRILCCECLWRHMCRDVSLMELMVNELWKGNSWLQFYLKQLTLIITSLCTYCMLLSINFQRLEWEKWLFYHSLVSHSFSSSYMYCIIYISSYISDHLISASSPLFLSTHDIIN